MPQNLRTSPLSSFLYDLFLTKESPSQRMKLTSTKWVAIVAVLFSFVGYSQTISIGSPVDATEGSGTPASFIISLDNGAINATGSDITGTLGPVGGSASAGSDYLSPVSFAIPNGANSVGVLIPIVDDILCEGVETIMFTLSSVIVGTINPSNSVTSILIFDDDCSSQVFISIGAPVDGVEGSSDITFDVFIEGGLLNSTGSPITGNISYAGGANPTNDYIPVNSFSIPDGANSTTITLTIIDDTQVESTEPVIPTLTGAPSTGSYANTTVTANIIDDDAASLTLSIGSPVDGAEGSSFVSYVVFLDNGLINSTGSPIVGSITYSGTAIDGADYTSVANFSIPDGVGSSFVVLSVIDDALVECNETVIATISNPNIGTINPASGSSTANIIDDECAQFGISIGFPVDGAEGLGDVSFVVSLDNGATNGTGSSITGAITYSGTSDFGDVLAPPTNFSIPDGANSTVIVVPVIDDLLVECDETVIATISNPSAGIIANATSTAIIVDNECSMGTISIGSPTDGEEGGADASFVVSLDNGLVNGTGTDITGTVSYGGTATNSVDYTSSMSFSIPDGASFTLLNLVVIDDTLTECDETVIATISNPSFGTIGNATDTTTIIDDECTNSIDDLVNTGLRVYPNPVSSQVNFSAEQQMSSYSIIDLKGRVLSEGDIDAKEMQVNTAFLSAGAYLISIAFEDGTIVTNRIVKE